MTYAEWKRKLHAAHLCTECKKQDAYTLGGRWHCADCAEKRNKRQKELHDGTDYWHNRWELRKAQQFKWREQGLCFRCGHYLEDKRYKTCSKCRAKTRKYKQKVATPITRLGQRGKDGRCWTCNNAQVEPGFKTCAACHAKLKAQMAINRSHKPEKHPWMDADKLIFHVKKGDKNAAGLERTESAAQV